MKKKGKKDKKDKQEELKEVNKPRWWIHTIVDSIIDWLSVLLIATVLSSCMSQSNEEKPSIDYDDNLEQLLQNPGLLNNSEPIRTFLINSLIAVHLIATTKKMELGLNTTLKIHSAIYQ